MMEFQRNPFDPHDIQIHQGVHPGVHAPVPQSVLQIGVDPTVGLHYFNGHHESLVDNNLLKHPEGEHHDIHFEDAQHPEEHNHQEGLPEHRNDGEHHNDREG